MKRINGSFREQITKAVYCALQPLPIVVAGWEGGSVAFGAVDQYSDIDLCFLVDDDASFDVLYAAAETALQTVSPVTASHFAPPGRYYKLQDGGEFLLVDLCFIRVGAQEHFLDVERHGQIRPLFDKGAWLQPKPLDEGALAILRDKRFRELQTWFVVSQSFVRKAIMRSQQAEALACYWGYTLKPLTELIRMRYCPVRWDFGMRYLERDLPSDVYSRLRELIFVRDFDELAVKLDAAGVWGTSLLRELDSVADSHAHSKNGNYQEAEFDRRGLDCHPISTAVSLRDVRESDLPYFFEQQRDPVACNMAAFTAKEPQDRDAFTTKWLKILCDGSLTKQTVLFDGQVAGNVVAFMAPWSGQLEVSYWIGREFWGRGIATAALAALLASLTTRPLFARAAKDNAASIRFVTSFCG